MNGIVLYVDLVELDGMTHKFDKIICTMNELVASYESSYNYLKECEYKGLITPNVLKNHSAELQDIEEKIRSLQSCLKSVVEIYQSYEKDFNAKDIGNLYATTPFYKTNAFKIGVGVAVVATCVVLAVVVFPASAIVTGAAIGAATGAIAGGAIGGYTSKKHGGKFIDGFADGVLVGSIGGAVSGAVGGATATVGPVLSMITNGATDAAINVGETLYHGEEVQVEDVVFSFVTGAVVAGASHVVSSKLVKWRNAESAAVKSSPGGIKTDFSNEGYRNGAEWNEFFAEKYSAENVVWETKPIGLGSEGSKNSGFKYNHNPSDNQKVLSDALEDSSAVYGYSPNPASESIGGYANGMGDIDWSDSAKVSTYQARRESYHLKNDNIDELVINMRKEGYSTEEIARAANAQRNQNRLNDYIINNDMEGLERVKCRNIAKYGNEYGLTAEDALKK